MDIDEKTESPFDPIFQRNVPHILEKIFFYLDYESYLKCTEVTKTWKKMLLSESFQRRAKIVYKKDILIDQDKFFHFSYVGDSGAVDKFISCRLVDVNSETLSGKTALHYALMGTHEVIKMLLDAGADPNKKDKRGQTPLFLACTQKIGDLGYPCSVKLLLDNGADPNTKDIFGCTPLHYAVADGIKDAVKVLLDGGALPDIKNKSGETPLYLAGRHGGKDIFNFIMDRFCLIKKLV